jgi:hypothetical protein
MRFMMAGVFVAATACGQVAAGGMAEVVTRDSAGIAIVEHPAGAFEAMVLSQPGEPVLSIGGLDVEERSDATFLTRAWLGSGGLLALNGRENRFVRFDDQGAVIGTFGGRGDGPDEFQAMMPVRVGGDSLLLIEMMRSNYRLLQHDLSTTAAVTFGEGPSFRNNIFGALADGTLLAVQGRQEYTDRSGPQRRDPEQVVVLRPGTTSWDTVLTSRGFQLYPMVAREGNQEFPTVNMVTFGEFPYRAVWGGGLVLVDNSDWSIALHDLDGAVHRLIRLDLPRRPVTDAMRDSVFARDERQLEQFNAQIPQAMKDQFLEASRAQQFADSVAPYDRIITTRDGLLWMRINEMPVDTSTQWLAFSPEGVLSRRLQLPKRWMLLDADGDRILIRRLDDDDIGYLEVRPLERMSP